MRHWRTRGPSGALTESESGVRNVLNQLLARVRRDHHAAGQLAPV
jgi:hypothetical protein